MSDFEEDDWVPPSEAELKVLAAKRERSDKISKRIGDYLLKGYKMLATTCPVCQTIELEDKQGQKYCVACQEIDCHETSKDDPVLNPEAAEKVIAESAFSSTQNRLLESCNPDVVPPAPSDRQPAQPSPYATTELVASTGPTYQPPPAAAVESNAEARPVSSFASYGRDFRYSAAATGNEEQGYQETGARPKIVLAPPSLFAKSNVRTTCQVTLVDKLNWANQQLAQETRVPQAEQLVNLIKSLLETIEVLDNLQ